MDTDIYQTLLSFQDSYRQVMKMRSKDLRKRLMVKFKGEEGLDYGGVARWVVYIFFLFFSNLNNLYRIVQLFLVPCKPWRTLCHVHRYSTLSGITLIVQIFSTWVYAGRPNMEEDSVMYCDFCKWRELLFVFIGYQRNMMARVYLLCCLLPDHQTLSGNISWNVAMSYSI